MKSYGPGGPRGPPPQIPRSTHSRGVPRQSSQGAPFLILKPPIEVTIMLTQPEFPAHRRRDPLRLAELQAYTEFMNSDRAGRALYELKTSRNVPELDFAILLEDVAGGVDDGFTGCKVIKNHRDRAMVLTVLDTGLRLGEIAGLQVADLQDGWLQVDGKTGERQVPVSPEVLWT